MSEQFKCQKCGRKFRTEAAAARAVEEGCRCGSTDIDVDTNAGEASVRSRSRMTSMAFDAVGFASCSTSCECMGAGHARRS